MSRILIVSLISLISCTVSFSQNGKVSMHGKIQEGEILSKRIEKKKFKQPAPLAYVNITLFQNGDPILSFSTDEKSAYEVNLEPKNFYQIEFKKLGYITKLLEVRTEGMNDQFVSRGFDLITDITLFKNKEGIDMTSYSKLPVAICAFNKRKNSLTWDMNYAENAFRTFVDLMLREPDTTADHNDYAENEVDQAPRSLQEESPIMDEIDYAEEIETLDFVEHNMNLSSTGDDINIPSIDSLFELDLQLDFTEENVDDWF